MLQGPDVARLAPDSEKMRMAFTVQEERTQRRSDGTVSLYGVRFEVPSRLRHLRRLQLRFKSWDLSQACIVDGRTGSLVSRIYPVDKSKNADGRRRSLEPVTSTAATSSTDAASETTADAASETADAIPPLMQQLLSDYAATGLPPAYIPKDEIEETVEDDDE